MKNISTKNHQVQLCCPSSTLLLLSVSTTQCEQRTALRASRNAALIFEVQHKMVTEEVRTEMQFQQQ